MKAQNQLQDDFSSNASWTQVGTNVSVNTTTGRVDFTNLALDGQQRRIHRPLGDTINAIDTFAMEIEFTPTAVGRQGTNFYSGHVPFSITAGTQEPFNNCSSIPCSGYPIGIQDGIMVNYIARNPSTDSLFFIIKIKDSIAEYGANTRVYTNNLFNTTFYLRLEKPSCAGIVRLSVFSDPARTVHLPGSPITEQLPNTVEGLHILQIGNVARGDPRRGMSGNVDNLNVEWGKATSKFNLLADTTFCPGDSVLIGQGLPNASYLWSTGSTDSLIFVKQPGQYFVDISQGDCLLSDTVNVTIANPPTFDLGKDTTICQGDSILIGESIAGATYSWNTGSTAPFIQAKQAGVYWLEVNLNGCTARDSITIRFSSLASFSLGGDISICDGDSVRIGAFIQNATYSWNTGQTTAFIDAKQLGVYWLEVMLDGCTKRDSIRIDHLPNQLVDLGKDTSLCQGDSILIGMVINNATYLWNDGSTNPFLRVKQDGLYWLEVTVSSCKSRDSINVSYANSISVNLGEDTSLCSGDSIQLDAGNAGSSYLWSNGSTSQFLTAKQEGSYMVEVRDGSCTSSDTININYLRPLQVNLGEDQSICLEETANLNAFTPDASSYLWQDFSTSSNFNVKLPGIYHVTISNQCETISDTVQVSVTDCECRVYIPNVFSPNSDNINDSFAPVSSCNFSFYQFSIFNRWGEKVFTSLQPKEGWDGNEFSQGSYVYLLEYETPDEKRNVLKGVFLLIR